MGLINIVKDFVKNHPVVMVSGALTTGLLSYGLFGGDTYEYMVRGEVIAERRIKSSEEGKKDNYMLFVEVEEKTEKGTDKRFCTFNVVEDLNMPMESLDAVVDKGAGIYTPHLYPGIIGPEQRFKLGCFGTLKTSEVYVPNAWMSSEEARQRAGDHYEERVKAELERAKREAGIYFMARKRF